MELMYSNNVDNNYFINKSIIGFVGELSDLEMLVKNIEKSSVNFNKKVKSVIGKNVDFIKPVGWESSMLRVKISELSGTDYKILQLIKAILLKPELIILNNFEIGINSRVMNRIIRFLKTINATFNIKLIIISRDALFLNKIANNIIVMKKGIIKYQGKIIPAIKQNLLSKPEIIKFIDKANKKSANIEYVLDEKELLKIIYRSVT